MVLAASDQSERQYLFPLRVEIDAAHPAMLQAIAAGKKKNDRVDARKIADLLRCDYFPECHMASREIRDRRRVLRYRNLLVRQAVQMKNKPPNPAEYLSLCP